MEFRENELSFSDYCDLRSSVGWNNWFESQSRRALENSLYVLTLEEKGRPVAMGRLIGDGMYYLMVDVVVRPEYQGQGLGSAMVDRLLAYVEAMTPADGRSSVQLIAEPGMEGFYLKKGFKQIPHEFCGSAFRKIIRK
ncbi:MAG: GNAT family N-acetyltransferase [Oscillospiraceae bacterium]|nr:GNAT family N-acetyltransferase [Oscillospiraceae bacterium]